MVLSHPRDGWHMVDPSRLHHLNLCRYLKLEGSRCGKNYTHRRRHNCHRHWPYSHGLDIPFHHKLAVSLRRGTDPHIVIFVDRIPSYPSTPGDSPEFVFWSTASLPASPVRYVGNPCLCLPRPLDASMYTTSQGFG